MKPTARQWHDIAEPYRAGAWSECARLVRSHVDRDPYDLSTRALFASLLLRDRRRSLALMQYERLLPLAIGQGRLFRALGTQRRLDELHRPDQRHPERYRAIYDWFHAVGGRAGAVPRGDRSPLAGLLALPPESFEKIAEQAHMISLDLDEKVLPDPEGLLWVVYFGVARWSISGSSGVLREGVVREGDAIWLPPGTPAARWLEVVPETPCEVIAFDPQVAAHLSLEPGTPAAEPGPGPATTTADPEPEVSSSPEPVGLAGPAPDSPAASATDPEPAPSAPAIRPRPDPLAEPMLAAGTPRNRRRDTRMAVLLDNRVALLGEKGADASPLHGTVVDVSTGGIGLRFPAEQIRHGRGLHPQARVTLQVGLKGSGEALPVTGRIAWIEWEPVAPGDGTEVARIGVEFVAMSPEDRTRLVHLLDSAARSGA